ncbi:MAG TPA: DUF4328 domain-containing protein [Gaiellaceae bacterium]|nr:DUF4328 domain-containing protein [Gaiellaceae bacterium]
MASSNESRPDVEVLGSRARWAQVALLVVVIVDLVAVGSDYAEYQLLGREYTLDEANANDLRQGLIGIVQFLLLIATAVVFIRWFKRAYENVEPLGGRRRYGTGWAIGGWFVPILNLWRPKQIANDIWRATEDERSDASSLLTLWWVLFLLSNWISNMGARLTWSGDTADDLQASAAVYAAADSIDVAAAILAIWIVRTVTRGQTSRAGGATGDLELAGAA